MNTRAHVSNLRRDLLALTALALGLRLAAAARAAVILRDGIDYLHVADTLAHGAVSAALAHPYPPGYPALIALPLRWGGPLAALALSALASALLVPAVGLIAARTHGPRAARTAALAAAALPAFVVAGAELWADGLLLTLSAWTLLAGLRAATDPRPARYAAAAGVLAAWAYLTRPEALALPLALTWTLRRRPRAVLALLAPFALPALAYLLWIRQHPALGGTGAGLWKLTLKRNLAERLAILTPQLALARALRLARDVLTSAWPLLLWTLLHRTPARARPTPWRTLATTTGGALTAAFLAIRTAPRYAPQLALLTLPSLAARARLSLAAAALFTAVCVPQAVHPRRTHKAILRDVGLALRDAGVDRVLSDDSRPAFYAGAGPEHLLHHLPDARDRLDPAQIARVASDTHTHAVILEVHRPAGAACARAFAAHTGLTPRRFAAPGQVAVDVFLIPPHRWPTDR